MIKRTLLLLLCLIVGTVKPASSSSSSTSSTTIPSGPGFPGTPARELDIILYNMPDERLSTIADSYFKSYPEYDAATIRKMLHIRDILTMLITVGTLEGVSQEFFNIDKLENIIIPLLQAHGFNVEQDARYWGIEQDFKTLAKQYKTVKNNLEILLNNSSALSTEQIKQYQDNVVERINLQNNIIKLFCNPSITKIAKNIYHHIYNQAINEFGKSIVRNMPTADKFDAKIKSQENFLETL